MPRTQESEPDELVGALPQFGPAPDDDEETEDPSLPPADETPPTTSSSPKSRPEGPASTTGSTPSSTGSSEPQSISLEDLTDAIGDVAGQLFQSSAQWLNRRERRRRRRETTRWLATQDEVEAMGQLAERYLVKQVPDAVTSSEDASAVVVGGLILAGYAIRNLLASDDGPLAPAPPVSPGRQEAAPGPGPAPVPARAPAPAVIHGDEARTGVAPAEAPLDVISPQI